MGNISSTYNKKERENPLCISLNMYELDNTDTLIYINNYVITNYNSQFHRIPGSEASILFRFTNEDNYDTKKYKLRLTFDNEINVDKKGTYKEGDTLHIKLLINSISVESSFNIEPSEYKIDWDNSLKNIKVVYKYI